MLERSYKQTQQRLLQVRVKILAGIVPSIFALTLAMFFSSIGIIVIGKNPLEVFRAIIDGAFSNQNAIAEVLVKTCPLLLAGLGMLFAFRCQVWNIGAEGQILIGALASSVVALAFPKFPIIIGIVIALLAAFIAGGLWAGLAGFLKIRLGASEIINTIMLNYVAIYLISYLVRGPLKDPTIPYPMSPRFAEQYWLMQLMQPTRLHIGILIALLAAFAIYIILWYTPLGFRIISVGSNPKAARLGGISDLNSILIAMFISGGMAGLAGAGEVLGLYHRLLDGISAGYGFSAMAVAILGSLHPLGASIFAVFFAALRVGADSMQRELGVPSALVHLIEGLVIIFVQGRYLLPVLVKKFQKIPLPFFRPGKEI